MLLEDTYGKDTNELIYKLLEKVEQLNTDRSKGAIKALFYTSNKTISLAKSSSLYNAPLIIKGQ